MSSEDQRAPHGGAHTILAVMAKAPRPGDVKTRLSPPFSLERAARFYAEMLGDVLALSAAAAAELGAEPWIAVAPDDGLDEVAALAPPGFQLHAQRGDGLSQRMEHVLASAAAAGAECLLLRGSDSPALAGEHLRAAREALDEVDVALCPDPDGGYSLVALRTTATAGRGLFDHAMSTDRVLDDTLAHARALGLRSTTIAPCFDIDTVGDLAALAVLREQGELAHCERTIAFLDRHDLWGGASGDPS